MPTTPGLLRYPASTDPVQDGANAIRRLAEDVEATQLSAASVLDANGRRVPLARHLVNYGPTRPVPKPPGMAWLPFDVLGVDPAGRVVPSRTPQQILDAIATLPNAGANPAYLDPVLGDDAAVGVNPAQPWRTLGKALTTGAYRHYLAAGEYPGLLDLRRDATSGNRVKRFYGAADPRGVTPDPARHSIIRMPGDTAQAAVWTQMAGAASTWQTTLATTNVPIRVLCARRRDDTGRALPLFQAATAADVNTHGAAWHYDAATRVLTVRYGNASSAALFDAHVKPNLHIVYRDAGGDSFVRMYGNEAYWENVAFVGTYPWLLYGLGGAPKAVFYRCSFLYSQTSAAVIQGGTAVFIECEFYRCQGDGVNSHVSTVEADHVVLNSTASHVGDVDTLGVGVSNRNAVSMHENGRAAVLGLRARRTNGPVVIDTGSAAGTGVSWWLASHAEDSIGSTDLTNYEARQRTVWMDRCSETGTAADPVVVRDAPTVLRYGANAVRGYTPLTGALAVPYDPTNPA